VATALLVAGPTLTLLDTRFAFTYSHSSVVQSARLLVPINAHVTWWPRSSHGGQLEDRTLVQRSQRCHNGEFRHISISTRQRSLQCGQNLRGPFVRATLPMRVGSCARAMADNGETKGLITPPPRWVSAQLLYVCVTAW